MPLHSNMHRVVFTYLTAFAYYAYHISCKMCTCV